MSRKFEIRLDYKTGTGKSERVFLAMAEYINAFEGIIGVVSESIDLDAPCSFTLDGIEFGSIKSTIKCIGKFGSLLSKIPEAVANQMVDLNEISEEKHINTLVKNIEDIVSKELNDQDLFDPKIEIKKYDFAKRLESLIKASENLVEGEKVDLRRNGNVIRLNTNTRFSKSPDEIFSSEYEKDVTQKEILIVKKSVFLGDSQWSFKSLERNKSFDAPINDDEWLKKYQSRTLSLSPGDAVEALIVFDKYKVKGSDKYEYKNYKVKKVLREIPEIGSQQNIDFEI